MKYFIYHPQPRSTKPAKLEFTNYEKAKAEYKRLQEIYPSREMGMDAENEYGERAHIHSGRWN